MPKAKIKNAKIKQKEKEMIRAIAGDNMEFWADSTDYEYIEIMKDYGLLHGVTLNPTLVASSRYCLEELLTYMLENQDGPVAAQVVAEKAEDIKYQAQQLRDFSPRIIVKIPVTSEGIKAMHYLTEKGIPVMATAIFCKHQALFAMKAGANYLALYIGRIAEIGDDPFDLITCINKYKSTYQYTGKLLGASIRSGDQVMQCAKEGISAVTISRRIFNHMIGDHPNTINIVRSFALDWENVKQSPHLFRPKDAPQDAGMESIMR